MIHYRYLKAGLALVIAFSDLPFQFILGIRHDHESGIRSGYDSIKPHHLRICFELYLAMPLYLSICRFIQCVHQLISVLEI